jgi:tetratricopeptide (TPR) repeat protein
MTRRPNKDRQRAKPATASPPRAAPAERGAGPAGPRWRRDWIPCLLLAAAALVAYQKVWHAGFVWDDDAHVIRPDMRPLHGLWRIWFEPGATQQYYPVLYSAFWLELRLWGYSAPGYHVANVALHAAASCLLYRALRRLCVPGALLAAAAFALHPVCVESVAWISEQKNTLSAVFYLAAGLAYLRFDEERRPRWYAFATTLFVLALLSKTVTATLPAALLVVLWWKRGRLAWRSDGWPLAPWLALGAAAGMMTSWVERAFVGAGGAASGPGAVERFLVAGRAIWFYLGKIFWPANLVFIYPRWTIDARSFWQVLCPAAVLAALAALFALRRHSRGPLAAALLFTGTLFPALGFIDAYPFRFSYVADHFQYLAAAMMLSASAAAFALGVSRLPPGFRVAAWSAALCAVAALASLTWRQCAMYADVGTLWQETIARNPGCWMAHDNLGVALMAGGQPDEAIAEYRKALAIDPGIAGTHNDLGLALAGKGRMDEAIAEYLKAQEIEPGNAETHNNLGTSLRRAGRMDEAIAQLSLALEIRPGDLGTNFNLGNALLQAGRVDEAIVRYRKALEISPDFADGHNNLGNAFLRTGRWDEAIAEYRKALAIEPAHARAQANLRTALSKKAGH